MDNIPTELLWLIFASCMPNPPSAPDYRLFPLNLAHVSSRWRSVVFQIPEVWTCIRIEAFQRTHPVTRRRILDLREEQLALWFSNAQDKSLALDIDLAAVEPIPGRAVDGKWSYFLQYVLIKRARSIRALQLAYNNPAYYLDFFNSNPTAFPNLEEVRLQYKMDAGPRFHQVHSIVTVLNNAPKLTRLMLNQNQSLTWFQEIPFHQLTHLTMPSSKSLYNALASAPLLQRLCLFLETGAVHQVAQPPTEILTMVHLERLTIHSRDRTIDQSIFSGINLPGLTHFHLFTKVGDYFSKFKWTSQKPIHDHFIHQFKNLRTLSIIIPNDVAHTKLIEVFESTKQLETLILELNSFSHPEVLCAMNDSENGTPKLMPRLKQLYVFLERKEPHLSDDSVEMTARLMARMVSTRSALRKSGSSLRKAIFWTKGPFERHPGYHVWRRAEETLKTQLDRIPGLESRVICVQGWIRWLDWWNRASAIEDEIL